MTFKRLLAVALALTLALATLLPALAEDDAQAPGVTQEPAAAAEASPETVVMTVNDQDITKAEVDTYVAMFAASFGYDISDDSVKAELQNIAEQYAIQTAVFLQQAKKMNIVLTDEEKNACKSDWEAALQNYADNLVTTESPTENDLTEAYKKATDVAAEQHFTIQWLETNALVQKTLDGIEISEEKIKELFDTYVEADKAAYGGADGYAQYDFMVNYGEYYASMGMIEDYHKPFYIPEGIRGITHILLAVDADLLAEYKDALARFEEAQDAADKAAEGDAAETAEPSAEETAAPEATQAPVTQAELDALKAQILASVQPTVDEIMKKLSEGASFDDLIDEYNTDPGMQDAATKADGYNVHKDSSGLDIAFRNASFTGLEKIGDISEPVVSQFGVHILCYKRDVPSGAIQFTDSVREALYEKAVEDVVIGWINNSTIVRN